MLNNFSKQQCGHTINNFTNTYDAILVDLIRQGLKPKDISRIRIRDIDLVDNHIVINKLFLNQNTRIAIEKILKEKHIDDTLSVYDFLICSTMMDEFNSNEGEDYNREMMILKMIQHLNNLNA